MKTIRTSLSGLFVFVLAAGLLGCGGGSSVDQNGAARATASALSASSMGESRIRAGLSGGDTGGLKVQVQNGSFSVSGTLTNPQGGSLDIQGSGTYGNDGSYSSSLTLVFRGWKDAAQNIVLDGTLGESASATVSGGATTAQARYVGDLLVSGAVTGTATFDLSVSTTRGNGSSCVKESGHVGGFTIDVKVGC